MVAGMIENTHLAWTDIIVIVVYFIFILGVAVWSSRQSNRTTVSGYFLANRSMNWIMVGTSLYATNAGSTLFVGLAGSGAASGIAVSVFESHAVFILVLLGWCFLPVYRAAGVYTMPEYIKKRFGGQRIRVYLSSLALLFCILIKISGDLFSGAIFIKQALNIDLYASVFAILAMAGLLTILGGITAVFWTDLMQTFLMLGGTIMLSIYSFSEVGGFNAAEEKYMVAEANRTKYNNSLFDNCGKVPSDSLHLFRDATSGDFPWTGITFGLTVSALWYWCSDQVIVQRVLAAKNITHAKAGCILAGYLKLLPLYLFVFPGMIARILFPDTIGCVSPDECKEKCGMESGCTNVAYPLLVINLLPKGLVGLMLAVMMSAITSTLSSVFNSSSTLFTIDIWTRIRKNASDMELLIVGRVFVLVLVVFSIIWIPILEISQGSQLFVYTQSIVSYLAPPICAIYVLAIFWERTNEPGAFWGLMIGLTIGIIRFGLEFGFPIPPCGSTDPDPRPEFVKIAVSKVHYLHFGIILFLIVVLSSVIISLLTEPINKKHLYRLTYWTRNSKEIRIDLDEENKNTEDASATISAISDEHTNQNLPTATKSTEGIDRHNISVPIPTWRKMFNFLCGIQSQKGDSPVPQRTELTTQVEEVKLASDFLSETPLLKKLCNVNAIIAMVVCSFLLGFYA